MNWPNRSVSFCFDHCRPSAEALQCKLRRVASTTASPFREPSNIAVEYLYPYYLVYEGLGTLVSRPETFRTVSYQGLDNNVPLQWMGFHWLRARRTPFYCLNDNFGDRASPIVERMAVRFLERAHPEPSRFES